MGMSNRAVPDSYRTFHTQAKNHLLNQNGGDSDFRYLGEQMPNQPSFHSYQYDMAKRHGVEPPKEEADDPMKGIGKRLFLPQEMNTSPQSQNYLQSLRDLLMHQDKPTEFK